MGDQDEDCVVWGEIEKCEAGRCNGGDMREMGEKFCGRGLQSIGRNA